MKNTIGKKILTGIFIPFLLIFTSLAVYTAYIMTQYFTNRTELELKGISDINAAQLEGKIDSVRISVLSAAEMLGSIDGEAAEARKQAGEAVRAMFVNKSVYNAWLAYESDAFDGNDALHTEDYPGAPSGRFMLSYVIEDGKIIVAPDMDEKTIDNPELSPWYAVPKNENRLYIDVANSSIENLYDYGVGGDPVYTLSVVSPLLRDGAVIGCVGADVMFDTMTFGIDNAKNAAVAVFYPDGRVFYAEDIRFAEDSVDTLHFSDTEQIRRVMADGDSLFLPDEYCPFLNADAFTYFHPVHNKDTDESKLYLYVALPRAAVFRGLTPMFALAGGVAFAVLAVLFIMFIYVKGKISNPINALTLSADAVSQGNLETEIAFFSDSQGEIGMLSRSLRRMVEQFRVYILRQEQIQEEMCINLIIQEAVETSDASKAFSELAAVLGSHFSMHRVTIVLEINGKASVTAHYTFEVGAEESCPREFLHHTTVTELLYPNRKLTYLNEYAMKANKLMFAGEGSVSVCIVPLLESGSPRGYIIFENNSRLKTFKPGTEYLMIHAAGIISEWLYERKPRLDKSSVADVKTVTGGEAELPDMSVPEVPFISSARLIEGLFVDNALELMGGMTDVYEQSVRMFTRTVPQTSAKLDEYLSGGEINEFTIEIHGIKGALNNIGGTELGAMASRLETASKNGDVEYCLENYEPFKTSLTLLYERLTDIAGEGETGDKKDGDIKELKAALLKAKEFAEEFDSMGALEILSSASDCSYGSETDEILVEISGALESFNCEAALKDINNLEEMLNGSKK